MIKTFEIGQSNEIIYSGEIYDLHNCYDYVGIVLEGKNCQLKINFKPNVKYGKGKPFLSLIFTEIAYLEFSPNFGTTNIADLDEMGYKSSEDKDDSWLLNEQQATDKDHIFFRLENNEYIRVYSKSAKIIKSEVTNLSKKGVCG